MWRILVIGFLLPVAFAQSFYISTPAGPLRGGVNEAFKVAYFLGIPYAKAARWKRPVMVTEWEGVLEATRPGPACPQRGSLASRLGGFLPPQSEDCLNLNIWMPVAKPPAGGWPVMVFVHGGSFTNGSGAEQIYDGTSLAMRGAVVVTINYRLGVLGFLALPAFQAEDQDRSAGNYGLLDQLEALAWVRRNIGFFDGNPGNVTLFGHSAGGMSVCALLASPLSKGLFHKAILQSGGCEYVKTLAQGFKSGLQIAGALGCPGGDAACLRALPLASFFPPADLDIGTALRSLESVGFASGPYKPHVDGYVLNKMPLDALRQGAAQGMPLIAGATSQETWGDVPAGPGDWASWLERAKPVLNDRAEEGLKVYQRRYPDPREAWAYFQSDRTLVCPSLEAARAQSRYAPTYAYLVTYVSPVFPQLGSFHGIEIPLLFGTEATWPFWMLFSTAPALEQGQLLAKELQERWTNFARSGDPGGWPSYQSGSALRIDTTLSVIPDPLVERCAMFQ